MQNLIQRIINKNKNKHLFQMFEKKGRILFVKELNFLTIFEKGS
jgi:hypothetical protein